MSHPSVRNTVLLPVLCAAVALLAACSRDVTQAVGEAATVTVGKTKDIAKDVAITAEVNARLARDTQTAKLSISVDTENGRVVLRGAAPDSTVRSHVAEVARTVDGVLAVQNDLVVKPGA